MTATERDDTRALLDVVLEAVEIPHAATVGDEETRAEILTRRVIDLVVTLRVVADDGCPLAEAIPFLRDKLAEHPAVGYLTADELANRRAAGVPYMEAVREGQAAARRAREATS